ncbi:DUF3726 domain-containing protein [Albidovulum sp.]|uniref:DUF3726 domain-containing protein n=1 Tax=Albidovulum sp. TaxID=1872424 RepID=UPI0039B8AFB8
MRMEPDSPTRAGAADSGPPQLAVLSRNEIEALCARAARGAGLGWGHAEEAGFAVGWLHAQGIDGATALLAHLDGAAGRAWRDLCPVVGPGKWVARGRHPICPLALGAALSDHCELPEGRLAGGLSVSSASHPVLVLPFLSRVAGILGETVRMRFFCGAIDIGCDRLSGDAGRLAGLVEAAFTLSPRPGPAGAGHSHAGGYPQATLSALGDLALRTTVPPSARSRADAGAGTGDND